MEEFKLIGHRIKVMRLEKGVQQTVMAKQIGMSQTNLSNVESGRTATTIQVLLKIRDVLDCKMADFFVDFDGEEQVPEENHKDTSSNVIELEDALKILKLLKNVEVKGL